MEVGKNFKQFFKNLLPLMYIYEYQSLKRYNQVQKSTRWELHILSKVQDVQVNLSQPSTLGIQHSMFNVHLIVFVYLLMTLTE